MAFSHHKTAIGVFTVGGLLLFVLGLVFLGGGGLFKHKTEYVLYFEGSVSGLNVGAPVVFRGVPLGNVTRISLVFDRKSSAITIPVFIHIDESSIVKFSGERIPEEYHERIIQHMVKNGLSARLQVQNLVTGQYRIELDYHKHVSTAAVHPRSPNEIPTVPSPMDTLQKTFERLPIKDMTKAVNAILMGLSTAVGDGQEIAQKIVAIHESFNKMDRALTTINTLLESKAWQASSEKILLNMEQSTTALATDLPLILKELSLSLTALSQTTERLKRTATFAEQIFNMNSPAVQDLRRVLKEAAEAARSLHNLADMLNRNPEALLHGKKGLR
ncbi:MAG: MCE family protein [Desulfovibrio sp.]|nr:MCE family protein [Desulfovibrio sp.]